MRAPSYLQNLLVVNRGGQRTLRSNATNGPVLIIPRTKRKTFADRSFSVSGPVLWNQLPSTIREVQNTDIFKRKLKTHLLSKQIQCKL